MRTEARPEQSHKQTVTERVLSAVARSQGVEPHELEPSLYDVINPDALRRLYEDSNQAKEAGLSLQFTYNRHVVEINSAGDVTVSEAPQNGRRR